MSIIEKEINCYEGLIKVLITDTKNGFIISNDCPFYNESRNDCKSDKNKNYDCEFSKEFPSKRLNNFLILEKASEYFMKELPNLPPLNMASNLKEENKIPHRFNSQLPNTNYSLPPIPPSKNLPKPTIPLNADEDEIIKQIKKLNS